MKHQRWWRWFLGLGLALTVEVPQIRIVLLTAYDDPSMQRAAAAAGARAYLVKGCSAEVIVGTLERVMQ